MKVIERIKATVLLCLMATFLTACNEPQPQTLVDSTAQQQQDDSAMDTAVAAAAGAAVGSIAGNMLSRPSQPVQQAQRPVIINRTTVINKQPSRSSRSFSYSRPSSRRR